MYHYQLYGIHFHSVFPMEGLPLEEGNLDADVQIKAGRVQRPPEGMDDTLYKPNSVANQTLFS